MHPRGDLRESCFESAQSVRPKLGLCFNPKPGPLRRALIAKACVASEPAAGHHHPVLLGAQEAPVLVVVVVDALPVVAAASPELWQLAAETPSASAAALPELGKPAAASFVAAPSAIASAEPASMTAGSFPDSLLVVARLDVVPSAESSAEPSASVVLPADRTEVSRT